MFGNCGELLAIQRLLNPDGDLKLQRLVAAMFSLKPHRLILVKRSFWRSNAELSIGHQNLKKKSNF